MNKLFILFLYSFLIFITCSKDSTSPNDDDKKADLSQLKNFNIDHVYYDSLHIESQNLIILNSKSVEQIILGTNENGNFLGQDSIIPAYVAQEGGFYLNFQFREKIDKSLIDFYFTLRYVFNDNSIFEVDSSASMLKYPYKTSEVFITTDEVSNEDIFFQDFVLNDKNLFFHPTGPLGLYVYNFTVNETTSLVQYSSGNHIAFDSIYVFFEIEGGCLYRYNQNSDTTDLKFDLSNFTYQEIKGLDTWKDYLYVLFRASSSNFIGIFDFNGNYITSIPYSRNTYFLTIHEDIAYSIEKNKTELSLFDLKMNTFLENKEMPTNEWEGIRIYNDNFYYVDYSKRIIGFLPLSELK